MESWPTWELLTVKRDPVQDVGQLVTFEHGQQVLISGGLTIGELNGKAHSYCP